jgi:hypothetical protein
MNDLLSQYSTWALIAVALALAVSIVAFLNEYRQAKRAPFYFWRQESAARSRRLLALIVVLALATAGLSALALSPPARAIPVAARPTPSATATHAAALPLPTATATAEPPATLPPSPEPTATETATATPAAPTAPPKPRFDNLVLAAGVTNDKKPVGAGTQFPFQTEVIYAIFNYTNMLNGMPWTHVWLQGDQEIGRETESWQWGYAGTAFVFFGPIGGYITGTYRMQLWIGQELQQEATFSVQ